MLPILIWFYLCVRVHRLPPFDSHHFCYRMTLWLNIFLCVRGCIKLCIKFRTDVLQRWWLVFAFQTLVTVYTQALTATFCSQRRQWAPWEVLFFFFPSSSLFQSTETWETVMKGCSDRYGARRSETWGKIHWALCRGRWDAFAAVLDLLEFLRYDALLIFRTDGWPSLSM